MTININGHRASGSPEEIADLLKALDSNAPSVTYHVSSPSPDFSVPAPHPIDLDMFPRLSPPMWPWPYQRNYDGSPAVTC